MEGFSKITYQGKTIFYSNYSIFKSDPNQKQKILELLKFSQADMLKQPSHSVLSLIDVSNLKFDMEILKFFTESTELTSLYEKRIAVVGVKGLLKAGYNFVTNLTRDLSKNRQIKAFDTELEAKEWLIIED